MINITQFRKDLSKSLRQLQPLATQAAFVKFNSLREKTMQEFDQHAVTQELEQGPEVTDSVVEGGNLYSLLGFYKTKENPIGRLREELYTRILLNRSNPIIIENDKSFNYNFTVFGPNYAELQKITPLPDDWAPGRSWLDEVEDGVSGLLHYVYLRVNALDYPPSRSTRGLQIEGTPRHPASVGAIPYMRQIIQNLKERLL